MGNFEKLSVLVIVVIIVMILVVAIYEWTGSPSTDAPTTEPSVTSKLPTDDTVAQPAAGLSASGGGASNFASLIDDWNRTPAPVVVPETTPGTPGTAGAAPGATPGATPGAGATPAVAGGGPVTPATPGAAGTTPATPAAAGGVTEYPETTHVVATGESLSVIAQKHWKRASWYGKIIDANPGLDPMRLRVGQKLKIPAMKVEASAMQAGEASGESLASSAGGTKPKPGEEYTVRAGDTWESISKRVYDTTERWPEIYMKNMNKTSMKELRKGLVIALPK